MSKLFCTFKIGDFLLGLETSWVQEVVPDQPITRVPLAKALVAGVINLRGEIVTAIDLRLCLKLPSSLGLLPQFNLIIRSEDGLVSLLVDEVFDVVEVSDHDAEAAPKNISDDVQKLTAAVYKQKENLLWVLDAEQVLRLLD